MGSREALGDMLSPDDSVAHATAFRYLDGRFSTPQPNCSLTMFSFVRFLIIEVTVSECMCCLHFCAIAGHEVSRIDSRPFIQQKKPHFEEFSRPGGEIRNQRVEIIGKTFS